MPLESKNYTDDEIKALREEADDVQRSAYSEHRWMFHGITTTGILNQASRVSFHTKLVFLAEHGILDLDEFPAVKEIFKEAQTTRRELLDRLDAQLGRVVIDSPTTQRIHKKAGLDKFYERLREQGFGRMTGEAILRCLESQETH